MQITVTKKTLSRQLLLDDLGDTDAVFHEGACSATTEWDGNNYEYSKELLHYCLDRQIPFLYASSAATYGDKTEFREEREFEGPLNVYGYSKFLLTNMCVQFYLKRNHQYVVSVISTCMVRVKATKVQWQAWHST